MKNANFDQPFDMMEACHERLQRMLALIGKLRAHMAGHGADEQAQQAARDVMRYFDQAAPQHHEDEEKHVFPPLLARGEAVDVVRRLQRDHVWMEEGWREARAVLDDVAHGEVAALSPSQEATLQDFAELYADHILAEEQIAYPAAQRTMDDAGVAEMGREMAARRGAATPR
ncbi:hemerythrin domain-containing protein [Ramlibacter sp.]|uniref:hemerythrin domain-containing protein n=1 Tax=Ramlibacter sp. TaxID=1917967 RepID=UPI003D0BC475